VQSTVGILDIIMMIIILLHSVIFHSLGIEYLGTNNSSSNNNLSLKLRVAKLSCPQMACDWTTGRKQSHSNSNQLTDKRGVGCCVIPMTTQSGSSISDAGRRVASAQKQTTAGLCWIT